MTAHTLLLVGHGKMGGVLLERWKHAALFSHIHVISPRHTQGDTETLHWHRDLTSLPQTVKPDVVVFAVKPALLEPLLAEYALRFAAAPLYLSVAAGKTLAFYHRHLGEHAHMVRAMPNTPALIGEGMTALCAHDTLSAAARQTATRLMDAVGKTLWLEEDRMDAATAIAGCGPAYVFLFIESLVEAGMQHGLSETQAKTLALQTVHGAQSLAAHENKTLAELRMQVASPGGATEAALAMLTRQDALKTLLQHAATAAIKRSREMAQ